MTNNRIAQTNNQQKSESPKTSGILQRTAIRSVADIGEQSTVDYDSLPLSSSANYRDFSQVPVSTTKPPQVFAKLMLGPVGDKYEIEADRVAAQVVQRTNAPASKHQEATGLSIQAKYGTIASKGQERLTVLQAKMDGLLNSQLKHATRFGHNIANIPLRRPQTSTPIQAKLTIGEPGDKYEQEADETARQVVQRIHQQSNQPVQREAVTEEEELQTKPEDNIQRQLSEEEELQMKPMVQCVAEGGMAASADVEAGIQRAKGGGQSLVNNIREPMEQAFGADFSGVRVHTDSQADQLNQSIQAKAFTTGQDVFFQQGAYEPGSRRGQELLAHELTHVVQQGGGTMTRSLKPLPIKQQQETFSHVENQVVNGLIHAQKNSLLSIQRRVLVNDKQIDDVIGYLNDQELNFLDESQEFIADYMAVHPTTFKLKNAEDIVLEVEKADSMIKLVRSILSTGILSRRKLMQRNKDFVGSMDSGDTTKLAVNVLDARGDRPQAETEVAENSMTAEDRGSISVSMERQKDIIKEELISYQNVNLTSEEENQLSDKVDNDDELMALKLAKKMAKADTYNAEIINSFKDALSERALRTVMAIIPKPDKSIAHSSAHTGSYESDVPSEEIVPGEGGFTTLLLPAWMIPFERLIEDYKPKDIEFRYVGTKEITANYKAGDKGQISVTIDAPDYASEVAPLLQKFRYLATHIVTG